MTDELTRRQRVGAWATARRAREAREVSRGHVDAALAERHAPKQALVVESLEARLARLVPGARVESAPHCGEDAFQVWRGSRCVGTGPTAREAIERAIALYGGR